MKAWFPIASLLTLGFVACRSQVIGGGGGSGGTGSQSSTTGQGGQGGSATGEGEGGERGEGGEGGEGGGPSDTTATCEAYCDQIAERCTGVNSMYANRNDCFNVCGKLPRGREGDIDGNSLACRSFYLASASDSPADNCRYAGPGTEGKCGGNCENFCFLTDETCTGDTAQWPNQAACVQDCQEFSQDEEYVVGATGDNFACRLYQLTQAATNPPAYCDDVGRESPACSD